MHEEKPTFKDLLRKHKIVLGAVAAQAGVEIRIAYKMEQREVIHGVYADRLLAALSHLTGQTYTHDNVGATATRIAGRDIPVQYIVECDQHSGFPDSVWQSDIVMDPKEYGEEPAMVKCPYCGGLHYAYLVEQCPNNPNRKG